MMFPSPPRSSRQAASSRVARSRKRLPSLEPLEGRQLMSLVAENSSFSPVNTTRALDQFDSDNASSSSRTVIVWTDTSTSTNHDIRAQLFDSLSIKVGPELVVANSSRDEVTPAVAVSGGGNIVVTWTETQPGGDTNVLAQRFSTSGARLGGIIPVGVGTFKEQDPDVAIDARGNFVVSYTRDTNGNNADIFAKRYDGNGQPLGVVSVATSARAETHSTVAMASDGRFNVAWEDAYSAFNHAIKLNRYSAAAGLLGALNISSRLSFDSRPSVAMENSGSAVVAWQKGPVAGIKAMRVSSSGSTSAEITISDNRGVGQRNPSVAMTGGVGRNFVVAYDSLEPFTLIKRVKVVEVITTYVTTHIPNFPDITKAFTKLTTFDAGARSNPAISIAVEYGSYKLSYTSNDSGDRNIRGRRGRL